MSARRIVTIMCNHCYTWWEEGQGDSAAEARIALGREGWKVGVPNPNGGRAALDFCPVHRGVAPRRPR